MDTVMIEKLQAMKSYRRRRPFLPSLVQFSLTTILVGLFLSCPLWLLCVLSYIKLIFAFDPKILEPKWLLLVCNIIVVLLVGKSKFSRPSARSDLYEEYVGWSKSLQGLSTSEGKHKGSELEKPLAQEDEVNEGGEEGMEEEEKEEEEKGERSLDELNKRVEDFIARVNKQRRLEARMVASCG